jgi:hypothetical protein
MASSASEVRVLRGMIGGGQLSVTSWRAVSNAMMRFPRRRTGPESRASVSAEAPVLGFRSCELAW